LNIEGGKSRICITKNLDGINDPNFRCTIFRRTYPELARQGGLIDESKEVYSHFKGEYGSQAKLWKFPSGASIAFSAIGCDDDLGSWQGSQLVRACVDEAADKWTEKQVLFLLSRLRSGSCKIHPQLIMSCNPDIGSFLKKWCDFCLDPDTGVPVEGTENRIRWFVTLDNKVLWADSPEECFELHGKPRGMIYAMGMSEKELSAFPKEQLSLLFMCKSFRFIPTGVFDNPYLLPPRNTSYLANLLAQPHVNQLKYLHGSWTAKEQSSGYFKREWVGVVDFQPNVVTGRIRAWDFAASEPSTNMSNTPDWSVGVRMSRDKEGIYYIEDMVRFQARTDKVLKTVIETAKADGLDECSVCIPIDSGSSGKTAAQYYARSMAEQGVYVKTKQTTGHSSKLTRFKPLCALAESGSLRIVGTGEWQDTLFTELENFEDGNRKQKDDIVDSCSDSFAMLARSTPLPTFLLPNLPTLQSPIPKI
jgi:predicted phage terminase large subunit-like protein